MPKTGTRPSSAARAAPRSSPSTGHGSFGDEPSAENVCSECGFRNKPGLRYCANCGMNLAGTTDLAPLGDLAPTSDDTGAGSSPPPISYASFETVEPYPSAPAMPSGYPPSLEDTAPLDIPDPDARIAIRQQEAHDVPAEFMQAAAPAIAEPGQARHRHRRRRARRRRDRRVDLSRPRELVAARAPRSSAAVTPAAVSPPPPVASAAAPIIIEVPAATAPAASAAVVESAPVVPPAASVPVPDATPPAAAHPCRRRPTPVPAEAAADAEAKRLAAEKARRDKAAATRRTRQGRARREGESARRPARAGRRRGACRAGGAGAQARRAGSAACAGRSRRPSHRRRQRPAARRARNLRRTWHHCRSHLPVASVQRRRARQRADLPADSRSRREAPQCPELARGVSSARGRSARLHRRARRTHEHRPDVQARACDAAGRRLREPAARRCRRAQPGRGHRPARLHVRRSRRRRRAAGARGRARPARCCSRRWSGCSRSRPASMPPACCRWTTRAASRHAASATPCVHGLICIPKLIVLGLALFAAATRRLRRHRAAARDLQDPVPRRAALRRRLSALGDRRRRHRHRPAALRRAVAAGDLAWARASRARSRRPSRSSRVGWSKSLLLLVVLGLICLGVGLIVVGVLMAGLVPTLGLSLSIVGFARPRLGRDAGDGAGLRARRPCDRRPVRWPAAVGGRGLARGPGLSARPVAGLPARHRRARPERIRGVAAGGVRRREAARRRARRQGAAGRAGAARRHAPPAFERSASAPLPPITQRRRSRDHDAAARRGPRPNRRRSPERAPTSNCRSMSPGLGDAATAWRGPPAWQPPRGDALPPGALPPAPPLPAITTCPHCLSSVAPDDAFCGRLRLSAEVTPRRR